jgi:cellobiose phosphorylase
MLPNQYGHFEDNGRAFRITDPNTPMPWVNVICTGRYGLVVSQNGGGFSWFDDAQHNVLTRWEMDLVRDCYGKFMYVSDLDSGDTWSLSPQPCRTKFTSFSCVHEVGKSTFFSEYNHIAAEWALTVSHQQHAEVWKVTLTNKSTRMRSLRAAAYFEWCCNTAPDTKREFHRLFFDVKNDESRRAIIAHKNMWDIRPKNEREHWNRPWPYVAGFALSQNDAIKEPLSIADKELFLGKYGSTSSPQAMDQGAVRTGGFGRFGDAVCALGGDISLKPGESVTLYYTLAIGQNQSELLSTLDHFASPANAQNAHDESKPAWDALVAKTKVSSAREDFDILNNYWLPYQAVSGRLWGRTGYYQQSGAFGFRDQLQDSQVWLPLDPAGCKKQILLHAARQFTDGSVYHWWHALADFGNHTACSDDYLWLPFVVSSYIRETGDYSILQEVAPFVDEAPDGSGATLAEHCRRSIARAFKRTSARGLPFIGSCDWNDGLSAMGIDEKGESVWLGMFLCQILSDWEVILPRFANVEPAHRNTLESLAREYGSQRVKYAAAINALAWDEQSYYKYGTKDSGEWVGASSCPEGKLHLNAQTWSILTDVAPRERATKAWEAVKRNLLTDYGPLLLHPAYTIPDPTIGYVTRYSPGSRENGGVYMHAATWALAAACKVKDQAAVSRIWNSIAPPTRGRDAKAYYAEPYVLPGNVDGPLSDKPGRAGWTWYTGSAAWLNRVSLEWILGIRPTWSGLLIDPCPPSELGTVHVSRWYRGVEIQLSFDAGDYAPGASAAVTANGKLMTDGLIDEEVIRAARETRTAVVVHVVWRGSRTTQVDVKPESRSATVRV